MVGCVVMAGARCETSSPQQLPAEGRWATASSAPSIWTEPSGTKRLANSVGMSFIWVNAGRFKMGSPASDRLHQWEERQHHDVTITSPFWIGIYEVTRGQYEAVMGTSDTPGHGDERLPITDVTWEEAMVFCSRLSQREGRTCRLPTEAEWEYCCRAGTTAPWFWGDRIESLNEYVVWRSNGDTNSPHPVGSRKPNPWGLYDMLGNVDEWVLDKSTRDTSRRRGGSSEHQWDLAPYPAGEQVDPHGAPRGHLRVTRGGHFDSWEGLRLESAAASCRSAARKGHYSFMSWNWTGFRVVCETSRSETGAQSAPPGN